MARAEAINWLFTINNPSAQHEEDLGTVPYRYLIFQYEQGEEGTVHIQGYFVLQQKMRLTALKKLLPTAHLEVRRGTHLQAKDYCSKPETRLDGPYEYGSEEGIAIVRGQRTDMSTVKADIDAGAKMVDIARNHFGVFLRYERGLRSYMDITLPGQDFYRRGKACYPYLWGPSRTGKTRRAVQENPGAYRLMKPERGADVLWGDYEGQDTVIVDEFYSWIPYTKLLTWVDKYPGVLVRKLLDK